MRYLYAILALGLLIAVHELGHLLAARLFGIRVRQFSFGFGPPIFSIKRRGTEWRLGAFLLGGNVKLQGSNPHEEGAEKAPGSFLAKAWWKRVLVLGSGSVLNVALAVGVLVALFVAGTHVPVAMTVGTVEPGSVAARAQLLPGDLIAQVDGEPVSEWGVFVAAVVDGPGRPLRLTVRREGAERSVVVVPAADATGAGRLGVSQQYVFRTHTVRDALPLAFGYIGRLVEDGAQLLWRMGLGRPGADVVSPVLIVKHASDVASVGWDAFLRVLVHLSVGLALFNLIPLPSLDGGRMVLTVIEAVRGKKLDPRLETAAQTVGFFLLLALFVWVMVGELRALGILRPPGAPAQQQQQTDGGPS